MFAGGDEDSLQHPCIPVGREFTSGIETGCSASSAFEEFIQAGDHGDPASHGRRIDRPPGAPDPDAELNPKAFFILRYGVGGRGGL